MLIKERIKALNTLAHKFIAIDNERFEELAGTVARENPWFTPPNIKLALRGISSQLKETALSKWIEPYNIKKSEPKTIGLVLAGNIPLVGFHDLLCVLLTGNKALIKMSSKDSVLTNYFLHELIKIEPRFESQVQISEQLKNFDAVIATGSDNSSRYFDYYFGKYPHIIRKNRTSCSILTGFESTEDLIQLGYDVFNYFGLGCRNVSKLFIPKGYELSTLLDAWEIFQPVINHHKYCNNYDYQKAILMVNRIEFYDNGFVILTANEKLVSPISVLFYEQYSHDDELKQKLNQSRDKIQCIVGSHTLADVSFGQAQFPKVSDYADQVDTIKFLLSLN